MNPIGPAEWLAYLGLLTAVSLSTAKSLRADRSRFFLAGRQLSGWAACLSLLASELTVVALLGLAGGSFLGDHAGMQLSIGYLVGRVGLSVTLFPTYFQGTHGTAYQRLHMRFGVLLRWVGTGAFMGVRLLRDTVVLFAACSLLARVAGWSLALTLAGVALASLTIVWSGGVRAVAGMDVAHVIVLAVASLVAVLAAADASGGLATALGRAGAAGKLNGLNFALDLAEPTTFWAGLVGGAAWAGASHGTDHLMVQRLLATGSIGRARWALIGTGVLFVAATSGMLVLGTLLWTLDPTGSGDVSTALVELPGATGVAGLQGWIAAALFVSAVSTLAASSVALGSSTTYDVVNPALDADESHPSVPLARAVSGGWLAVLVLATTVLRPGESLAQFAIQFTTVTYGVLLGLYTVAAFRRVDPMRGSPGSFLLQRFDAWAAVIAGVSGSTWMVTTTAPPFAELAWPWYVPVSALFTIVVGLLVRTVRKAVHDPKI